MNSVYLNILMTAALALVVCIVMKRLQRRKEEAAEYQFDTFLKSKGMSMDIPPVPLVLERRTFESHERIDVADIVALVPEDPNEDKKLKKKTKKKVSKKSKPKRKSK